jgi:large subunit ribosomal protein L2
MKKFKPTTSTLRYKTIADFTELAKKPPEPALLRRLKKSGGRNATGLITSRRRGGGHKRKYRVVDFYRHKKGIKAQIKAIEYDPSRSARIALIIYLDGERAYIIAPLGIKVGDDIIAGPGVPVKIGNAMPLSEIPVGTDVHNVEIKKGKGAQVARSAGSYCTVVGKENGMVHLRMPSSEIRLVHGDCCGVIGQVGNIEHENIVLGSAGRARHLGRRPKVRGVAMNPVDHPMGGGEGKSAGGGHPVSPWGKKAKGKKTRSKKRASSRLIIRRRTKKKKGGK